MWWPSNMAPLVNSLAMAALCSFALGAPDALPPLKTEEFEVSAEVSLRYARVTVLSRVRNAAAAAQEALFSLALPDTAFVSGFVATVNGERHVAYVKEKNEAKREYENATAHGYTAAHVSKARDSNQISVRVNVAARAEAVFNLTYEELLQRRHSLYQLAVNLHPGGVVPRLRVRVRVAEPRRITTLRVPALRTGNEVDAGLDDPQNPTAKVERSEDEREAVVTFEPDEAEQRRLLEAYETATRRDGDAARGDAVRLELERGDDDQGGGGGALGQFVVQYDVEHTADGEVLLNDGYFVHFYSPPSLAPLPKHVVFALDTSGSMMERKIAQLRDAMASILRELRPVDHFHIVEFASAAHVHELESGSEPPQQHHATFGPERDELSVPLPPAAAASPQNVARALRVVAALDAAGGTNVREALVTALRLVARGVTPAPTVAPQPMVIFLTDGDPTVGELDTRRILKRVSELNTGRARAPIFCLAFGEDADRGFLRKLSLRNDGFMRHIYEAADAAAQLRSFYRQVSSPLLTGLRFVYPPDRVDDRSVTRRRLHTLYAGTEVVVAGRRVANLTDATNFTDEFAADVSATQLRSPARPHVREAAPGGPLERLWAYLSIAQKLEERDAAESESAGTAAEREALRLALKYSFVTPLTALVLVADERPVALHSEPLEPQPQHDSAALALAAPLSTDEDYGDESHLVSYDAAAAAPPHLHHILAAGTPASLATYGLAASRWAAPLLQGDRLVLPDRTAYRLAAPHDAPAWRNATAEPHAACRTPHARGAACVYLPLCAAAPRLALAEYTSRLHCDAHGYAGVCCAPDEFLPDTAPALPSPSPTPQPPQNSTPHASQQSTPHPPQQSTSNPPQQSTPNPPQQSTPYPP